MRVVLYSHDAQGLGHTRRNLAIATALAATGGVDVLVITGAHESARFAMPPGVDCLTLPALSKSLAGDYRPRSLALSLPALIGLRARTILAAVEAFAPDVFIVDKLPAGIEGELLPTLEMLRTRGDVRLVLGLRDVLDQPHVVCDEWLRTGARELMRTSYDAIWVYGDPRVYDLGAEYGLDPDLSARLRWTGYLGRSWSRDHLPSAPGLGDVPGGPLALCLVGGGQDGFPLARAFAAAKLPTGTTGVVVTGPFMPADERSELVACAAVREDLCVLPFVPEPGPLIDRAGPIVSMGGYNMLCELLHVGRRPLVVPRVHPRQEQLIRGERLAAAGVLDLLPPAQLCPERLSEWLAAPMPMNRHPRDVIDLEGLSRLPNLLDDALCAPVGREEPDAVAA